MTDEVDEVRAVLARLNELYRARDLTRLDEAMGLFVPGDAPEMVGTEAVKRGDPDWAVGQDAVRAITGWDWRYWWEVELDVPGARITVGDDCAWTTLAGALVQSERGRDGTRAFIRQTSLTQIREMLKDEGRTLEDRLADVSRVGGARAHELLAPLGDHALGGAGTARPHVALPHDPLGGRGGVGATARPWWYRRRQVTPATVSAGDRYRVLDVHLPLELIEQEDCESGPAERPPFGQGKARPGAAVAGRRVVAEPRGPHKRPVQTALSHRHFHATEVGGVAVPRPGIEESREEARMAELTGRCHRARREYDEPPQAVPLHAAHDIERALGRD